MLVRPLYGLHRKGQALQLVHHRLGIGLTGGLVFLAVLAVVVGGEQDAGVVFQAGVQRPILLRYEIRDLLFPLGHQTHGHGLDTACRQAAADLLPQQR